MRIRFGAGLHPLTPYFSQLIAEEGRKSLKSLPTLHLLLKVSSKIQQACSKLLLPYSTTTKLAVVN